MRLPTTFWRHDDCGCRGREPVVGGRYRWRSRNPLTGEDRGWRYGAVIAVDPLRQDRILCRRVTVRGDDGREWRPFLSDFWGRYGAIGNVVPLRRL